MVNKNSIKILGAMLGIDFEKDPLPMVLDKLSNSGLTHFKLNWQPNITITISFNEKLSHALNEALNKYFAEMENSL